MSSSPLQPFQVSWHHLDHTIRERPSFLKQLPSELKQILKLPFAGWNFSSSRNGSYDLKAGDIENHSNAHKEPIKILQNLNGSFKSGQLTGILGPSGAGKTTLLNCISLSRREAFTGRLVVSESSSNELARKITINAIPQFDYLPEYLTVRENLTYASRLKNPTFGDQDHEKNVNKVSNLLALDECLDTRTKKISGGQQKRVAIGQELLSKPDILILDEPTSGLDSLSCLRTLKVLKDLVNDKNIAIVLTIHQPPLEALDYFDKIYALTSEGEVIYDGPPGEQCIQFVNTYSGVHIPSHYNPASFLIEIGSGELGPKPVEALKCQVERQFKQHRDSQLKDSTLEQSQLIVDSKLIRGLTLSGPHNFWFKTKTLTSRCVVCMTRDPKQMIARVLMHLILPLGMFVMLGREPGEKNACPHFNSEYDLQKVVVTTSEDYTANDRQREFLLSHENAVMFYILIYSCICGNIASTTLIFIMDMRSSLREYNNGWYSMSSYIVARFWSNIGQDLVLPTVAVALTYWLTGQNAHEHQKETAPSGMGDIHRVLIMSLALVISNSTGQMLGMAIGAFYVDYISTALFVSQAATLPFALLSGFMVRIKEMSPLVRLLSSTSIYRHCLEATFIARYGFNVCGCQPEPVDRFVGSSNVTMIGVPESLRSFTSYWLNSMQESDNDDDDQSMSSSASSNSDDIFQLIAKQLSLFNTFGIEVRSCKDVVPYQLYDFALSETDLLGSFVALFALLTTMGLILFITLRLTVGRKASL